MNFYSIYRRNLFAMVDSIRNHCGRYVINIAFFLFVVLYLVAAVYPGILMLQFIPWPWTVKIPFTAVVYFFYLPLWYTAGIATEDYANRSKWL